MIASVTPRRHEEYFANYPLSQLLEKPRFRTFIPLLRVLNDS